MSNESFDNEQLEIPSTFTYAEEEHTPASAKILLGLNRRNRTIKPKSVDEIARLMLAGKFMSNGEAIKLSWGVPVEGTSVELPILLDGQNRLLALVKAGEVNPDIKITFLVIRGLDPATQATMDIGVKRSTADSFRIDGEENSGILATIVAGAWRWNAGDRGLNSNPKPTPIECQGLLREDGPRLRRAMEIGARGGREFPDLSKGAQGLAHYILAPLDEEHAPYFFRLVATGLNLTEGHPVAALRKRASSYQRTAGQPMTLRRQVGMIVRAWNRCVEGETMASLYQTATEPIDEPMNPMGRPIPMLTSAQFDTE